MKKKEKILVAMSGGVDSSVVAALLVDQGYDVTGMFAVNYDDKTDNGECWRPDYQDALRVSAHLGIPLLRWDFTKEYKKMVLDYMYQEYEKGRTPNPDVMCNKFVKFGVWLDKAKKMGFDKIATGHYACVSQKSIKPASPSQGGSKVHKVRLLCAKDDNKDQTYFLHQLTQKQLQHVLFPIGEYTKPEVRKLAKKFKLPTADKEESMGICFVGEVNMKEFLETQITQKKGKIILSDGTIIGEHDGLAYYTIGQRHLGFCSSRGGGTTTRDLSEKLNDEIQNISIKQNKFTSKDSSSADANRLSRNEANKPLFVVDKDFKKNQLVVGYEDDPLLYKKEIIVDDINWIGGQNPKFPLKCKIRMRHRQKMQNAECRMSRQCTGSRILSGHNGELIVKFEKPERAVTPGQFAVFYLKGECLGGGVVK